MTGLAAAENPTAEADLARPSPDLAEQVLAAALGRGGDFAELFWEEKTSEAVSGDDRKVDRVVSGLQRGAGLRLERGERTVFAFTERVDRDGLLACAEQVSGLLDGAGGRLAVRVGAARGRPPHAISIPFDAVDAEARCALLRRGHEAGLAEDPRVRHLSVRLSTVRQDVVLANSEGVFVADERSRIRYRVQAYAREHGRRTVGSWGVGANCGFEVFDKDPVEKVARRAARQAVTLLGAAEAPAGTMPVVLAAGTGGVLVHEAIGHNLEGDAILKGASIYSGRFGERVAPPSVTVVDDATVPRALGSFAADDEGVPAQRTVLIDGGVLAGCLTDRSTAGALGMAPTGNGRRASSRHVPLPRMTNTFLLGANASADEILASTEHGIYVVAFGGGAVNPVNGSFIFTARECYAIRGGRLAEPLRGVSLMGNARDVLHEIDLVGDDLDLWGGNCGRGGQRVWTGHGVPTVRIRKLVVGGTRAEGV